jgi:nucleolar protein 16
LNAFSDDEDVDMGDDNEEWNGVDEDKVEVNGTAKEVVEALEDLAAREKKKEPRKQSVREREWIERLVAKYGDDSGAMMRDRKLNPMQQTEADIRRRLNKYASSVAA